MENNDIESKVTIGYKNIFEVLKKSKIKIAIFTFAIATLGAIYSLSIQEQFVSSTQILPEISQSNSSKLFGGFSSLAGLAGIDMDNLNSTDAVRPSLYPNILKSTPFLIHILNIPMTDMDGKAYISLGEYLTKGVKTPVVAKFIGSITGIFDKKEPNQNVYVPLNENFGKNPIIINKQQEGIINRLKSSIIATIDKKTGLIDITVKMPDPNIAGAVCQETYKYLSEYVSNYRTGKVSKDKDFLAEQVQVAKARYDRTRNNLASYKDRNRNMILLVPKQEETILEQDNTLAYGLFAEVTKKYEQTKLQAQNESQVFKILEPPQIPRKRSEPMRTFIVLTYAIFGFIVACLWAIFKGIDWSKIEF